jgi:CMP-N-acetylneuraminate monooxygenase
VSDGAQFTVLGHVRVDELLEGVNFVLGGDVIVFRAGDGALRATRNRCRHQLGRFGRDDGCVLTCAQHGWRLDVSTMRYVNPEGGLAQRELSLVPSADGLVEIREAQALTPWNPPQQRASLAHGELTLRFLAHACAEIQAAGTRLVTDPWLVGPAFTRGWWLAHRPPDDWLTTLTAADAIYVSHNHSDHLNAPTLLRLLPLRPDAPFVVPAFPSGSTERSLRALGFTNVRAAPFGQWMHLSDDARFMILQDVAGRDDSALLFEYKGHRILNTVDCSNPNGSMLPAPIDMLLTSFASGASGYPVCWSELYSRADIEKQLYKKRSLWAQAVLDLAKLTQARTVMPFAGYFVEAHPADADTRALNVKNDPREIAAMIARRAPGLSTWVPEAGDTFDFAEHALSVRGEPREPSYDFDEYTQPIADAMDFAALRHLDGVRHYFEWARFRGDLVLHVIETDELFQQVEREFFVDFRGGEVSTEQPSPAARYLRMRVRADVFRHILRWGLPWEEISIGFQARFYREPDVYNFDFWNHFQNELPSTLPF